MVKPIIGIVGRPNKTKDGYNTIDVFEKMRKAVIKNGGIPISLLPVQDVEYEDSVPREIPELTTDEQDILKTMINLCDGIIMPGANKLYQYDFYIYGYAYEKNIPVLGICAGMQLMGIYDNNGSALKEISSNINHLNIEEQYAHDVSVDMSSPLYSIFGKSSFAVNSNHKYMVDKVNELKVAARSNDGVIESVYAPEKRFVLGVQWHPEKMIEYDARQNKLFKYFIEKCSKK